MADTAGREPQIPATNPQFSWAHNWKPPIQLTPHGRVIRPVPSTAAATAAPVANVPTGKAGVLDGSASREDLAGVGSWLGSGWSGRYKDHLVLEEPEGAV